MRNGPEELLNLAFAQICADENLEPCSDAFEWKDSEASQWVHEILHNGKYLHYRIRATGTATPVLRS